MHFVIRVGDQSSAMSIGLRDLRVLRGAGVGES
jgi:hypothetical protein